MKTRKAVIYYRFSNQFILIDEIVEQRIDGEARNRLDAGLPRNVLPM